MASLVALKKLRYPRGHGGKEYAAGDTFESLSDRDTKALTAVRLARPASSEQAQRQNPTDLPKSSTEAPSALSELRNQYLTKMGKRPFMGWDEEALREKLKAATYQTRNMRAGE